MFGFDLNIVMTVIVIAALFRLVKIWRGFVDFDKLLVATIASKVCHRARFVKRLADKDEFVNLALCVTPATHERVVHGYKVFALVTHNTFAFINQV